MTNLYVGFPTFYFTIYRAFCDPFGFLQTFYKHYTIILQLHFQIQSRFPVTGKSNFLHTFVTSDTSPDLEIHKFIFEKCQF